MKRFLMILITVLFVGALYAQDKNNTQYVQNLYGGLRIGGTWSTKVPTMSSDKISYISLSGGYLNIYTIGNAVGSVAIQRSFSVAPADQGSLFDYAARKYLVDTLLVTDATYSLVAADAGRIIYCNRATFQEITIPAEATTSIPVGTVITFIKTGAGVVGVLPAANVIRKSVLDSTWMNTTNQTYQIVKRATNKWYYIGNWVD